MDTTIDVTGLLGVLCLAILALRGDRYARWLTELTEASSKTTEEWKAVAEATAVSIKKQQDRWRPWMRQVLVMGSFLGAFSYALAVVRDIFFTKP